MDAVDGLADKHVADAGVMLRIWRVFGLKPAQLPDLKAQPTAAAKSLHGIQPAWHGRSRCPLPSTSGSDATRRKPAK